jgi:hypothetical protein
VKVRTYKEELAILKSVKDNCGLNLNHLSTADLHERLDMLPISVSVKVALYADIVNTIVQEGKK